LLRFVSQSGMGRREFLRPGVAGLGVGLAGLRANAAPGRGSPGFGKARSVVLVYASGGQSQLELWDMKPDAPEEIRGAFRPIATSVPGVRICEHLPQTARVAHLFTILRSVAHDDLDHGSATYLALTGRFHAKKSGNPLPSPSDQPTYGAVLHRVRPARHFPQTAVHVNGPAQVPEILAPGQFAGLLGRGCEPLLVGDPSGEGVSVRGLDPLPELPPVRVNVRRSRWNRSTATVPAWRRTGRWRKRTRATGRRTICWRRGKCGGRSTLARSRRRCAALRPEPLRPESAARPQTGRGGCAVDHGDVEPQQPRAGQEA
jgi:hypothetical protein